VSAKEQQGDHLADDLEYDRRDMETSFRS